jgi:hypothetical protein
MVINAHIYYGFYCQPHETIILLLVLEPVFADPNWHTVSMRPSLVELSCHFYLLVQIEPQDGLPQVACTKCIEQVNRMVHFIEICQVSNKILTHLIQKYHVSFDSVIKKTGLELQMCSS